MMSYLIIKRLFDFIFAFIILIIASPVMLITVLAIKLESSGPSVFKQERPGKAAKIFTVYKFRTMRIETEKKGISLTDKERMTRVGTILRKSSIDEIPQLFNILRGDMSFIGPRPLLVQYLDFYSEKQLRRHEVTPGISGWAQVNGRNTISWEEKFNYDVWYVDNISFKLDVKILFLTIKKVLIRADIDQSNEDTMEDFLGSVDNNN
jgi:undecaprenyl phosphate N,N'-diacetylbacillosamine 1-phosphate transferase